MEKTNNMTNLLLRLWHSLSLRRRWQSCLLLMLMLLSSLAETISISVALPFLGVLTSPEKVFELSLLQPLINILNFTDPHQLILPLTVIFGLAALMTGAMRVLFLWVSTRLSFATGADLSVAVYRRTLYQPYSVHCSRNSSEIISSISNKVDHVVFSIVMQFLALLNSVVMLAVVLVALFFIDAVVALSVFGGFGLIYSLVLYITRKKLQQNSRFIADESVQVIKSLQEGLGGIRDVLIDGSQEVYCKVYSSADMRLRQAQGSSSFIANSPRYAVEALGMVLVAVLAFYLSQNNEGISKAIPILGTMILGAQRLLPALQTLYSSLVDIKSRKDSLKDVLDLLEQPLAESYNKENHPPMSFEKKIELKQISFSYVSSNSENKNVLNDVNLNIVKGARVGIIGVTGSGKSTLLDVVMGLLSPSTGSFEIDGVAINSSNNRAWQSHIAHVPQTIYLSDGTIEENIAFGIPKELINRERVEIVARQAQILDTVHEFSKNFQTLVGERGVQLSGGQRQRIGIARALYKNADVIIFDEATSALDNKTEEAVMQAVESLNKNLTLLIIAHRLTTLRNCTQIVELKDGVINRVGSYSEIIA